MTNKPILRVDFCDFSRQKKTELYPYLYLQEIFDLETWSHPDLIIYQDKGHEHRLHNCKKLYWPDECYAANFRECDFAITCRYSEDSRHLRLPPYARYVQQCHGVESLIKSPDELETIFRSKTKFCSFVVSNHGGAAAYRNRFFHELNQRKRVESGGRYANNIGVPIPDKLSLLRQCKFDISFMNNRVEGWTDQRLTDAMIARCVPIFCGNPRIAEEFNPKSMINAWDFKSNAALIDYILEVDRNDDLYRQYLREPYFYDNKPNEYFDKNRVAKFIIDQLSSPTPPLAQRQRWRHPGRWRFVKGNRF
jgi:alpha(1,3/1,4) fucosyltransferase